MYIQINSLPMKKHNLKFSNRTFMILLLILISISATLYLCISVMYSNNLSNTVLDNKLNISIKGKNGNEIIIGPSCNFFTCFNVYCCGNKGNQLMVYVYPQTNWNIIHESQSHLTKEFNSILHAIRESKYYTSNPNEACIFVPSIDMLNPYRTNVYISNTLNGLKFSERGRNHLIFNLMLENMKSYNDIIDSLTGQAMIAGIGYTESIFRRNFDISLPTFSTLLEDFQISINKSRKWFIISAQVNINPNLGKIVREMKNFFTEDVLILQSCSSLNTTSPFFRCVNYNTYKYPDILQNSLFCLILRGEKLGLSILLESLATSCIPVIIFDSLIMPFDEVIDWARAAVFIRETDIKSTVTILKKYSLQKIQELQNQGSWLYRKYFKSIKSITETTLDIIADRIFPFSARNYYFWNEPHHLEIISPVTLPLSIPKNDGFTAVLLTYDRIDLLFLLIQKLSKVSSLHKIIIIWNNEYKKPPQISKWPKIYKPIKIIQTTKNLLSNRFYPFDEIETEAILSIDDDIIMLTEDEIEFAYEVWREFPDRIVGFPSRTHAWDSKTSSWKYESEWTNRISMILTGAAFYHKYWNYIYTTKLPGNIKEWVDQHMNCEDIAMNFLVSNITKKAPIKVTAKKKFRCPECINTEMLSADLTHMAERTQCINQFTKVFGYMPLLSVEFRADPVLFKDNFPDKLKRFNNIGSL